MYLLTFKLDLHLESQRLDNTLNGTSFIPLVYISLYVPFRKRFLFLAYNCMRTSVFFHELIFFHDMFLLVHQELLAQRQRLALDRERMQAELEHFRKCLALPALLLHRGHYKGPPPRWSLSQVGIWARTQFLTWDWKPRAALNAEGEGENRMKIKLSSLHSRRFGCTHTSLCTGLTT